MRSPGWSGVPTDLAAGYAVAADLLAPILNGQLPNGTWDIDRMTVDRRMTTARVFLTRRCGPLGRLADRR